MDTCEKIIPAKLGKRDQNFEFHWKEIGLDSIKISKPTLLCFGGNRSMDSKDANAFCKSAEKLLNFDNLFGADDKKNIDLIGISYGHFKNNSNDKDFVETSNLTDEEIEVLSSAIFKSLYLDKNGNMLSVREAVKNFNLITTFSHSYGSIAINHLINKTYNDMIEKGYTYEDTRKIFSQIVSVSYAPRGTISEVSNIQIISGCDGYDMPLNSNKKTRNIYFSKFYNVKDKTQQGNGQ